MDSRPSFIETLVSNETDWFESTVMASIFLDKEFRMQAFQIINHDPVSGKQVKDFSTDIDHALIEMLRIQMECMGRGAFTVPRLDFCQVILQQMAGSTREIGLSEVPAALDRLQQILAMDVKASVPIAKDGIVYWLGKQRTQRIIQSQTAVTTWNPTAIREELQKNMNAISRIQGVQTFYAFGHGLDTSVLDIDRVAIPSLPGLTKKIGGGFAQQEATLFIAPQGSGKTVLACQLGADLAMLDNQTAIIVTTEQPHEQLEVRIVSAQCTIPFDRIKDGFNEQLLLPNEVKAYKEMRERLRGKLFWEDWNKGDRGRSVTTDLLDVLHRRQDEIGGPVHYLILDWIGGALGSTAMKDLDKLRHIYQATGDTLCHIAEDEKMSTIGFAQANMATSIGKVRIDANNLAECKTLGRAFTNVIGITALLDETANTGDSNEPIYASRQAFYISKARKGEGGVVPFFRDFRYQRMGDPQKKH